MKLTPDDKKKAIAGGAFALLAIGILYYELGDMLGSSAPTAAPAPVVISAPAAAGAKTAGKVPQVASASLQLDPTLKMGPMLVTEALVYSGGGRNIFSATSVPMEIPKAIAAARPKGPVVPVYVAPSGPPPPPPINLKFFGTATSGNGNRQAFLLHGEDVFVASAGDIVQRRYKVISVAASSIVVEDMTNNNRQTLPLQMN
ncbi:hypothetical protein [Granulicella sp. dw_53]|uniref:hypothetical protein n=1 Tax=Granulicella sp. dw_53 TaxID=2719792 RepID=UPI001BD6A14C|nr:hypothetical protein [Granulicella sp. dw_53]